MFKFSSDRETFYRQYKACTDARHNCATAEEMKQHIEKVLSNWDQSTSVGHIDRSRKPNLLKRIAALFRW